MAGHSQGRTSWYSPGKTFEETTHIENLEAVKFLKLRPEYDNLIM